MNRRASTNHSPAFERNPLWYKDAIIYEVHVRAFKDSNADGIGDFKGLTEKLDYLKDLGVTAVWLLPFYPSPLRDDGYDIADYHDVHPDYGSLHDFRVFLRAAHNRGLRVISELVLNHTSDQHPWFQRSREAARGTKWDEFYVWSDTPDRYTDTRIIFEDFEHSNWAWDPVKKKYYWHRFYSHQPDLNFESKRVQKTMFGVLDHWLQMGIDGLRLDAVPYLYQREGTTGENLPETHEFLQSLRRHVDENFEDRMLLAEANQWPEDAAAYFGDGNECHMAFHFPVMPRLFMAIRQEDRFPIVDILQQTPSIPDASQWALFLRNHDELTLEMVTDEDRDYMYRTYADDPRSRINLGIRRRLAPLLQNNRRKIELMNGLLFSLPGTPVLYYGDEIGMGDNIFLGDRNGVRTPMQWSADRNAGFSRSNPQGLYLPVTIDPEYHFESRNVEAQQNNPQSLLWWMKHLIAMRKRYRAFGHGSLEFLHPENRKILAFIRRHEDEHILVVANLSRFAQYAELDLSSFAGLVPVEVFGQTPFPSISEDEYYFLTLAPHSFYWLRLEKPSPLELGEEAAPATRLPTITVRDHWQTLAESPSRGELEYVLTRHLRNRRWFRSKSRTIVDSKAVDIVPFETDDSRALFVLIQFEYREGEPETYILPLSYTTGQGAERVEEELGPGVICYLRIRHKGGAVDEGVLYDCLGEPTFSRALVAAVSRRRRFKGEKGRLVTGRTRQFKDTVGRLDALPPPALSRGEQTNTSVVYGERLILKLFRHVEPGLNPDLEIGRFLSQQTSYANVPITAGSIEYRRDRNEPMTIAVLQSYIPNEGDAWRYTLDALGRYFERILAHTDQPPAGLLALPPMLSLAAEPIPGEAEDVIGGYIRAAQMLGARTAELHSALASSDADPAFAPVSFTPHYQRSLYQSARTQVRLAMDAVRAQSARISEEERDRAREVLNRENDVVNRLRRILEGSYGGRLIRCHGDYHLGQVLYTGKDFVIIDFEGEPARPLSQRRIKRSALNDVAGMIRSFHYASQSALREGGIRPEDVPRIRPWAHYWYEWVSAAFLHSYLSAAGDANWLPTDRHEQSVLLDFFLLEKAVYELRYELNNRPDWVGVPLRGILGLLEEVQGEHAP